MNTNFQPLSEQQCKEINGGVSTGLLGIPVIIGLPDLGALATGVGNTLVGLSASVSGLLVGLANTLSSLLGNIKL